MSRTIKSRRRLGSRDRGSSTVEYSLMVAAIAAMLVGVILGVGKLVPTMPHVHDCQGQQIAAPSAQCDLGSGTDGS